MSDHNAIILTIGRKNDNKRKSFRFESSWLNQDGFKEKVMEIWNQPVRTRSNWINGLLKKKELKSTSKAGETRKKVMIKRENLTLMRSYLLLNQLRKTKF